MGLIVVLRRLAIAVVAAGMLVALAVGGLYVTTAPEIVSLVAEPASLLLLPGLAIAMVAAGNHDYSPMVAILSGFGFYFVLLFAGLSWWAHRGRFAGRSAR